jgi:hypothetical protein
MTTRVSLLLLALLLLCACPGTGDKAADAKKEATTTRKDDPVVIADGSVRLYFRSGVFAAESVSPVYGCCLAAPAVGGKKEVRVYLPESPSSRAVKLAQTLPLNEADVVQFYLERQTDSGWAMLDNDKFPTPQLVLFRRDLSKVDALNDAQFADYAATGKTSWIISSEMKPKAVDAVDDLGKSLSMRRGYTMEAKGKIRLGKLTIKRADNSSENVALGTGCSAIEICTSPNCLAGMNSPCPDAPAK